MLVLTIAHRRRPRVARLRQAAGSTTRHHARRPSSRRHRRPDRRPRHLRPRRRRLRPAQRQRPDRADRQVRLPRRLAGGRRARRASTLTADGVDVQLRPDHARPPASRSCSRIARRRRSPSRASASPARSGPTTRRPRQHRRRRRRALAAGVLPAWSSATTASPSASRAGLRPAAGRRRHGAGRQPADLGADPPTRHHARRHPRVRRPPHRRPEPRRRPSATAARRFNGDDLLRHRRRQALPGQAVQRDDHRPHDADDKNADGSRQHRGVPARS